MDGERGDSPEPSCVSMKSDRSIEKPPPNFREEKCPVDSSVMEGEREDSPEPSCVSMKSDRSIEKPPPNFREEECPVDPSVMDGERGDSPEPSCVSMKSDRSIEKPPPNFREEKCPVDSSVMYGERGDSPETSCVSMKSKRSIEKPPPNFREEECPVDLRIRRMSLAEIQISDLIAVCQKQLKNKLSKKCKIIIEGILEPGRSALLNEIYTELYITEGWTGDVSKEHEIRQIETTSRRPAMLEKPIKCSELFTDTSIRTALTKGVAGVGKTVSVQKFILDWAEGKANQDVLFMIPLPFRELNLIKEKHLSLMNLLHRFFPELKEVDMLHCDAYKVVFILDGLDECRLPLNFQNNEILTDIKEPASVDVLLTNLIKGNLLPSAHLWITTRPAAANQIPPECVDQVTEVRGFNDPQKEEYFRKKISEQNMANKIISHVKATRSLHIMCHIPVFCWISATVLERMLGEAEGGETPKTLTQMFTHFLIFQLKHKNQKYHGKCDLDLHQTRETILALGKLAFQQLEKENLIFYEEDLRECGIDVREASVDSGVCTQIFREEFGLHLGKVFSFVHLSVQEFLAALFAFNSFINKNIKQTDDVPGPSKTMSEFLMNAVDRALQSENGHLDLYLRFLLGLSLESNQTFLQDLLPQTGSTSQSTEKTVRYIKEKISENPSLEKSINLFYCLNELNDDSLEQEVQMYLNRMDYSSLRGAKLSPAQWSALAFVLLTSEQTLDEFNLRKYDKSEEGLLRLLPVVKASRKALLFGCNLTERSCAALSSVLSSNSNLRVLNLIENDLQDSGVELLSAGLKDPNCKLETLKLCVCKLTERSCADLSSVLSSNSNLRELNLTENDLQDSGVELLSAGLKDLNCKLETLNVALCNLKKKSCAVLSEVLSSNVSSLKQLDLSDNQLQDSGVRLLSAGLQNPHCKLELLRLIKCHMTDEGCAALVSALTSNPSSCLRELYLSYNDLGGSVVKLLSGLLKHPNCKLEKLEVSNCRIPGEGCAALVLALRSKSTQMTQLIL